MKSLEKLLKYMNMWRDEPMTQMSFTREKVRELMEMEKDYFIFAIRKPRIFRTKK